MQPEKLLKSGYVVTVSPLPTYYLDFLDIVLPLEKPPKRTVKLLAGDTIEYDYEPPDTEPDPEQSEEHDLWVRNVAVIQRNEEIKQKRAMARVDFLLSACVNVKSGPLSYEGTEWITRLEAAFFETGFRVPPHEGVKKLFFTKAFVITHPDDRDWILQSATYPEVSFAGISAALIGYKVMWDGVDLVDVLRADKSKSKVEYDIRMYEAEAAKAFSIPFDHTWYSLPVVVREHMIALSLARTAIDNLQTKQAIENAGRK